MFLKTLYKENAVMLVVKNVKPISELDLRK